MLFLNVVVFALIGLFVVFVLSQIFFPIVRGTAIFPIFRKERKLLGELVEAQQFKSKKKQGL